MKKEKLIKLLHSMSLNEKIGQLIQLSGEFFSASDISIGPLGKLGISKEMVCLCGSALNVVGAKSVHKVQDEQMKKQPHHIPMLFMSDVIYGFKTIYPIPLGLGCAWNPELVKKGFSYAADEASAAGNQVAFAPMVDVVHDARWGRVLESPGEDPFLNSVYAKNMVEGLQENLKNKKGQAACVKHFAAYGGVEGGREYNSVDMSLSNLFQNYLPPYKAGIKAEAKMIMTSLTTLNGVPSTADQWLLNDILRKSWKFNGIIISDYASIYELIKHGFAVDTTDAALKAITAGVDIDMKSPCYANGLKQLITNGKLDEHKIDQAVLRILELKNELGLFEDPYYGASERREEESILTTEKRSLARKLSSQSLVMLKNDNHALPLKKNEKVALIGPYANNKNLIGMWAIHGNTQDTVTIYEGIKENTDFLKVAKGTDLCRNKDLLKRLGFLSNETIDEMVSDDETEKNNNQEAINIASEADTIILTLGEETYEAGEAGAKTNLELAPNQVKLLDKLSQLGKKLILILISGRPLVLTNIKDKVDAIIEAWFPGTEGGHAISDVLFGKTNPSGRLTMSFPYSSAQEPLYYNHLSTGRPENNSQHVGRFVSKYIDSPASALYPFGYGLSYGKIKYTNLKVSNIDLQCTQIQKISIDVTNESGIDREEAVQLYIHQHVGKVVQPVKRLIHFRKVHIPSHKKIHITFELKPQELAYYDNLGNSCLDGGKYTVYVGMNGGQMLKTDFKLLL
ncbi:beta-glucosidase BglX [Lactobacillus sp. HT06-2]|uniref:beta-glucosidase BglX n=1 Tax=Lactobacillus sp. HT06-2 TaxID=2080222 RepID=UPI000CD87FD0|nr:beta-glucosidase BglX [Lactobacillus sp. HT06-2]